MTFDCEELFAAMEEQKKEWAQYLKDEELLNRTLLALSCSHLWPSQAILVAVASTGRLSGSGDGRKPSAGSNHGSTSKDDKRILALSEKLKTIVKKVENDKENLINEINALRGESSSILTCWQFPC